MLKINLFYSRGLWPAKSGVIEFPLLQDSTKLDQSQLSSNLIYYLPQKPFVSDNGSLRQLIAYPSKPNNSIEETQWIIDKLNRYVYDFTGIALIIIYHKSC